MVNEAAVYAISDENATQIDSMNSIPMKVSRRFFSKRLLILLPKPMENIIMETIIVHWKTESPRKYVARVESMYSATIPERPVAKMAIFKILERKLTEINLELYKMKELPDKIYLNFVKMKAELF